MNLETTRTVTTDYQVRETLVGLGWSLWRDQRAAAVVSLTAAPAVVAGAR